MEAVKNKNGRFGWIMTENEFFRLTENSGGLCRNCGEESSCVEPDARGYGCDACGSRSVFGAEECLLRGFIQFGGGEE